jgi:hypothetical protein
MPNHTHGILDMADDQSGVQNSHPQTELTTGNASYDRESFNDEYIEPRGSGNSVENRPPYYALAYIMKT